MKECITHHHACNCREERFRKVLELAESALIYSASCCDSYCTCGICSSADALTQEDKDWIVEELKKGEIE